MRIELSIQKIAVRFVAVNSTDAASDQKGLVNACSFPLFQDLASLGVWAHHQAKKDDIFIYDKTGKLVYYLPIEFSGPNNTDLSTKEGYDGLKQKILSVK